MTSMQRHLSTDTIQLHLQHADVYLHSMTRPYLPSGWIVLSRLVRTAMVNNTLQWWWLSTVYGDDACTFTCSTCWVLLIQQCSAANKGSNAHDHQCLQAFSNVWYTNAVKLADSLRYSCIAAPGMQDMTETLQCRFQRRLWRLAYCAWQTCIR